MIHSFWCWVTQDQNLLKASLSTLCTLTANNKLAVNQIAQSNVSAQTANTINANNISGSAGLSLLNSIIKISMLNNTTKHQTTNQRHHKNTTTKKKEQHTTKSAS